MADWSNPNKFQLKALHEALLFAYPSPANLNLLLVLNLDKNYQAIAPVGISYENALLEILVLAKGDGWLKDLVAAAQNDKPKSPKLLSLARAFDMMDTEIPATIGRNLEDIVRHEANYQDLIPWVQKLEGLAWKTCRIEYPINNAQGTGWLIGPDLVITNWHVVERAFPGGNWKPEEFVCRFGYAATAAGTQAGIAARLADAWCLDSSPPSPSELSTGNDGPSGLTLDYAILKLEKSIGRMLTNDGEERGWVKVSKNQSLPKAGEIIFVVQHPEGMPVKLATGDIAGIADDTLRLYHTANTQPGASGSLIVNTMLEPIALHHAGDMLYSKSIIGKPKQNQAIPIGIIVDRLIENRIL
jgi:hypothetical protein